MTIRELAPAKINLFLQVLGRRTDNYHELVTVFQTISLHDEVELEPCSHGIQLICDASDLPAGSENLAYRAAALLLPRTAGGVVIRLKKTIPWQAGLGGGSSDAAAVLRGLNGLWELGMSSSELAELAAQLGSDVPFFVYGGTAVGTGRGELIQPLHLSISLHLLVVKPPFGLSTPAVFRSYRPLLAEAPSVDEFLQALNSGDQTLIGKLLHNDLEAAAFELRPELAQLKEKLLQNGALGCLLSGSGSSLFAILPQGYDADQWLGLLPNGFRGFLCIPEKGNRALAAECIV